ncbi:hypothetical protein [Frankia sp. AgB32]|uniref:hypothetical protein n=1 Tax=Frankia sp. AgB32 TaxID=631119 RepID=UPI0020100898|nr:hypothetical protein [Frankia sp. AgB32]
MLEAFVGQKERYMWIIGVSRKLRKVTVDPTAIYALTRRILCVWIKIDGRICVHELQEVILNEIDRKHPMGLWGMAAWPPLRRLP